MDDPYREDVLVIYDAIANPSLWPEVLDRVARRLNARGCVVFERGGVAEDRYLNALFMPTYYNRPSFEAYLARRFEDEYDDQDIFERYSLQSDGIDLIDDSVLAADVEQLQKRGNVRHMRRFGILHRAACLLNKDNKGIGRFSVQFGTDRGPLSADERQMAAILLPHIAKSMELGRAAINVERRQQALLDAIDSLFVGIAVLDQRGAVIVENQEFVRQRENLSTFRQLPNGRLRFRQDEHQVLFQNLMSDIQQHGQFGARPRKEAIAVNDDTVLSIELAPLHTWDSLGTTPISGWILYTYDTSQGIRIDTRPLKATFRLTDAELSVLDAICDGLTNTEIAERRGRAPETVNAQVKSILAKTDCRTRTQLVRLMMTFGFEYTRPLERLP